METKETILNKKMDLSKLTENRLVQIILNILFGLSIAGLNFILIEQEFADTYVYIILPILSFVIAEIMTIKFKFLSKTFKDVKKSILIVSIIFGIFETINLYRNMSYVEHINIARISSVIVIPSVIVLLYWFYDKLIYYFKKYIKSLDKIERNFLIITGTILIIAIITIYNITSVFHNINVNENDYMYRVSYEEETPEAKEKVEEYIDYLYRTNQYDTVYTSDTAPLLYEDVYTNIATDQNDIRQPLFGVFSIPFHIAPRIIANIFPNITNLYATLVAITQGILTLIAFTLLVRLVKVNKFAKILFLVTLSFAYPTLLFLLNIEQYAMPVFYLVVFIYLSLNEIKEHKDISYIAATGSMLTTGILFPLLGGKKNLKQSIKNIFFTFLKCMAILIISARIILVFPKAIEKQTNRIMQFSTSTQYTTNDKINMYTNFVKNTFAFSDFYKKQHTAASKALDLNGNKVNVLITLPAIRQADTTQFNIWGVIIAFLAIIGFALNRKDKFSQIAFLWSAFSFVLLFLMGWGTNENGLILYTFYFSWAFICLIYKLFEELFIKHEKIKNVAYIAILIPMLIINLQGMYQTIQFGIKYFGC